MSIQAAKLLLVDDEEIFRRRTVELLRKNGYDCDEASNAREAEDALKRSQYDLLLTDIKMPGNSDLEFFHGEDRWLERVPTIVLTAFPTVESAIDALRLKVADYITKPVDFDVLQSKISTVLQNHQPTRFSNTSVRSRVHNRQAVATSPTSEYKFDKSLLDDFLKNVSFNLKQGRISRGHRQVDLARMTKLDYRNYQKIEQGATDIKLSTLFRIADFLKLPVCHLTQPVGGRRIQPRDAESLVTLFEPMLDQLDSAGFITDPDQKIIYFNSSLGQIIAGGQESLLSHGEAELLNSSNGDRPCEVEIRFPGYSPIRRASTATTYKDVNGAVVGQIFFVV